MVRTNLAQLFSDAAGHIKKPASPDSRANDLTGKEWTRYSLSVWNDIRKTAEEAKLGHPAMFPGSLVERLLLCFTKESEKTVLDPFCGSGSTLVVAKRMGKRGLGFEVAREYYNLAMQRLRQTQSRLFIPSDGPEAEVYHADAQQIEQSVPAFSADNCVTLRSDIPKTSVEANLG